MEKKELIISRAKRKKFRARRKLEKTAEWKKIREESLRKIWRERTMKFQQDRELERRGKLNAKERGKILLVL